MATMAQYRRSQGGSSPGGQLIGDVGFALLELLRFMSESENRARDRAYQDRQFQALEQQIINAQRAEQRAGRAEVGDAQGNIQFESRERGSLSRARLEAIRSDLSTAVRYQGNRMGYGSEGVTPVTTAIGEAIINNDDVELQDALELEVLPAIEEEVRRLELERDRMLAEVDPSQHDQVNRMFETRVKNTYDDYVDQLAAVPGIAGEAIAERLYEYGKENPLMHDALGEEVVSRIKEDEEGALARVENRRLGNDIGAILEKRLPDYKIPDGVDFSSLADTPAEKKALTEILEGRFSGPGATEALDIIVGGEEMMKQDISDTLRERALEQNLMPSSAKPKGRTLPWFKNSIDVGEIDPTKRQAGKLEELMRGGSKDSSGEQAREYRPYGDQYALNEDFTFTNTETGEGVEPSAIPDLRTGPDANRQTVARPPADMNMQYRDPEAFAMASPPLPPPVLRTGPDQLTQTYGPPWEVPDDMVASQGNPMPTLEGLLQTAEGMGDVGAGLLRNIGALDWIRMNNAPQGGPNEGFPSGAGPRPKSLLEAAPDRLSGIASPSYFEPDTEPATAGYVAQDNAYNAGVEDAFMMLQLMMQGGPSSVAQQSYPGAQPMAPPPPAGMAPPSFTGPFGIQFPRELFDIAR